MNRAEQPKSPKEDRPRRALSRFENRIALPVFVAGGIAIVIAVAVFFTIDTRTPNDPNPYVEQTSDRETYYVQRDSFETAAQLAGNSIHGMESVIKTLEPRIEELGDRIEALDSANDSNWESIVLEVVDAWDELRSTYETIGDELPLNQDS